jgi:hypothetical protein
MGGGRINFYFNKKYKIFLRYPVWGRGMEALIALDLCAASSAHRD